MGRSRRSRGTGSDLSSLLRERTDLLRELERRRQIASVLRLRVVGPPDFASCQSAQAAAGEELKRATSAAAVADQRIQGTLGAPVAGHSLWGCVFVRKDTSQSVQGKSRTEGRELTMKRSESRNQGDDEEGRRHDCVTEQAV